MGLKYNQKVFGQSANICAILALIYLADRSLFYASGFVAGKHYVLNTNLVDLLFLFCNNGKMPR